MKPTIPKKLHFVMVLVATFLTHQVLAQQLSGTIYDADSGDPLFGASVVITGTATGATADFDGKFSFKPGQKPPFEVTVSYIGYEKKQIQVTSLEPLTINLGTDQVMLEGVTVTEQRVSDKQKESALTVESMDIIAIKETPAANFYDGLGNLKGVDLTAASIGFKVINTRGFNSTSPVRSLQVIDGVDNQSPGLNFSLGNFLGASELDVRKVDIVQGASSAFYGPNAFNGVIDMKTRDPFIKPGLTAQIKIGERNLAEAAVRWAQVFKNKDGEDKFAYKVNLFYLQAYDWEADNMGPVFDSEVPADNPGGYDAVNRYGDEDLTGGNDFTQPTDYRNYPGLGRFFRRGYRESDIVDYNTRNFKANLAAHYRIKSDLELIYSFNFGTGTTVYQGENRFNLKDILFMQNRLELKKKDKWFVRLYSTNEDAGKSFDAVVTAFKMLDNNRELARYYSSYSDYWNSNITPRVKDLPGYPPFVFGQPIDVEAVDQVLAEFNDSIVGWHQETSNAVSSSSNPLTGETPYPQPGSEAFNEQLQRITNTIYTDNSIEGGGARFYDKSALYHIHGEYKFEPEVKGLNLGLFTVGANGRLYVPDSRGTIFDEMRLNNRTVEVPDPVSGGMRDSSVVDTSYRQIYNYEFGVYAGWERKFLNEKLKVSVAARFDKNVNFPLLVSPAASLVYLPTKDHTIRAGFSSAIRNPTLSDQYLNYDVGRAILLGNLNGFEDLITVESFTDYLDNIGNLDTLEYFDVDPIVPEKVRTIEAGYRGFFFGRLYVDASYYFSIYEDFIGYQIGVKSSFDTVIGFPQNPIAYRVSANSQNQVITQGAAIGLSYFFQNKYSVTGNYSWNKLTKTDADDPIIPAFNTPEHKFNLGFTARDLGKAKNGHFGFSMNYKWIKGFIFEGSPQFTGFVPTYDMFDAQVSYRIPNDLITFKLGASNLFGIQPFFRDGDVGERFKNAFDNRNSQVYGGPAIGRMAYFSVLFEWN